jgi:hypothetical protein
MRLRRNIMTRVITAPEPIGDLGFKVYLAGAIDMGKAINWQAYIIQSLSLYDGLVLLNPRRDKFTDDTLDEQITWELHAMDTANLILMWFPKEAKAPISFFETGLYMGSGKLVLGAEHGFYRRRNLEMTSERYSVPLWSTLEETAEEVIKRYEAVVNHGEPIR